MDALIPNGKKTITIIYSPEAKTFSIKEEMANGTPGLPVTSKTTIAPQGSTMLLSSTNLRIFNGPTTIIHIPESKIIKLTLEAIQEKELPGTKKP